MYSSIVVTRKDLCDNIQDLPFYQIKPKHFKTDVLNEFEDTDIVIFFDDNEMKTLKNKAGENEIWVKQSKIIRAK